MAQVENFALRQQLKKLQLQTNSIEIERKRPRNSSVSVTSKGSEVSDKDLDSVNAVSSIKMHDSEIAKYGRKYSIMICPWIDVSVFDGLISRPDVDPLSEDRYASKLTMLSGTVAELYDFVPSRLHDYMENHSRFASLVSRFFYLFNLISPSFSSMED